MEWYGTMLHTSDPQRWQWLGRAAARGFSVSFFRFSEIVERFSTDLTLAPCVFAIGRALKGHVNMEKRTIFGEIDTFDSLIGSANRAIGFFEFQCAAARKAVDTWCLIARRLGNGKVNRDIRKVIGMMIWEARKLANYEEPEQDSSYSSFSSSGSYESGNSSDDSSARGTKRQWADER